jgi:hypothetical protein
LLLFAARARPRFTITDTLIGIDACAWFGDAQPSHINNPTILIEVILLEDKNKKCVAGLQMRVRAAPTRKQRAFGNKQSESFTGIGQI